MGLLLLLVKDAEQQSASVALFGVGVAKTPGDVETQPLLPAAPPRMSPAFPHGAAQGAQRASGLGLSSTLGSSGPRPGRNASPASGPAGRLPAGLGGTAAGLPRHPGERQGGLPLVPSHVCLARSQGSGSPGSGCGKLGVRVGDPGVAPDGGEALGPGVPGWTLLSASDQCPAVVSLARAAAATPE